MGDSLPLTLTLPELKYPIADEIERVRGFLGPVMRLSGRSEMKLSGKTVYGILTRSIVTVKKNEAWFHFAGQPMKFSIREFHMNDPERSYETPSNANEKENLSDEDAIEPATVIIETPVFTPVQTQQMVTEGTYDSTEPLTEIISATNKQVGTEATNETSVSPITPQSIETPFFTPIQTQQMVTEGTYDSTEPLTGIISAINKQTSASSPLSTLFENGADVEITTSDDATCRIWYPGNVFATNRCDGVEKVAVTLFADQKRVTVTADKIRPKPPADDREKKFEMMDNVEAFYSKGWSSGQVRMILGENTFSVYLNSSMETLEFKASDLRIHREWLDGVWKMADELKVTCILPPIPHDPEDDVSMEDEHSDELESVKDISKKGYKFKADDWKNRSVDTLDTLDALIHMTIHMTKNVETSQASASIEEDSENTKLNKIIELMMENAKSMKDRMSLLEVENMELRARVSELEGNHNVAPYTQTPVFPTNVTQQPETPSLQTQEFSHNLPRETGREPFNETPSLQTQEFSPNLTPENDPERSYEMPSNANEKENLGDEDATEPATVIIETQDFTPVLTQQVRTEATNKTPVSPISPQSIETPMVTKGMYDSTEALTEIISATNKESLTEIISATNKQVGTEATNETPFSPIAPQSIETPFFTLIQTQQMVTGGTYDSTEPLTEIISATNKEPLTEIISATNKHEDTLAVHNTPSSLVSSLISRMLRLQLAMTLLVESGILEMYLLQICVMGVAVTLFADQKRVIVTADKIRPKPPADDREKKFEMMDNVEAFYSKGWSSGQVRMILGENTFSVYLNSSMETLEFKASDLRIHREWLDGVWKMADETPLHEANPDQTASRQNEANPDQTQQVEYSTRFRDKEKKTKKLQESVSIHSIRPQPPPGDTKGFELMDKVEAYHNDGWCSGEVHIILSNDIYSVRFNSSTEFIKFNLSDLRIPKEWVDGVWKMEKEGKSVVGMKRKATAQPVDHAKKPVVGLKRKATAQPVDRLAFLQREEKRLGYWMQLCGIHYHVDAAFAMLNQKRIEQFSWFSEQGIPKACFVPVQFLETVGYSYENLQKLDRKGINILKGWVGEVVRGLIHPNKMWMQDVDIVYGVVHERLVDHFIGGGDTSDGEHNHNLSLWRSQGLIPAINLEMMNEEINFNDIIPFQVKKAEGLPKTKLPFNCGLFVVKTLE
ncbi:hypothetical protein F2Q69_00041346 [Brassica cretica]|uniref:Agenet domain-containing protein n=1 Tax=Brassica cretica TaxID=69181 RepID=A0A8S9NLH0_BRACR|nr:hypothetical protein F2Q69_00041346 [Brassica cretica]